MFGLTRIFTGCLVSFFFGGLSLMFVGTGIIAIYQKEIESFGRIAAMSGDAAVIFGMGCIALGAGFIFFLSSAMTGLRIFTYSGILCVILFFTMGYIVQYIPEPVIHKYVVQSVEQLVDNILLPAIVPTVEPILDLINKM